MAKNFWAESESGTCKKHICLSVQNEYRNKKNLIFFVQLWWIKTGSKIKTGYKMNMKVILRLTKRGDLLMSISIILKFSVPEESGIKYVKLFSKN